MSPVARSMQRIRRSPLHRTAGLLGFAIGTGALPFVLGVIAHAAWAWFLVGWDSGW